MCGRQVERNIWANLVLLAGCFLVVGFLAAAAQATTYYVAPPPSGSDNNPGTEAEPFATIQKAADIVNPGDTVIVKDGVYTRTAGSNNIATLNRPGTSNNWIIFKSENKWGAVLDGKGSITYGLVFGGNAAYVCVEGFDIKNMTWAGFMSNSEGTHHIKLKGNHIHHIGNFETDSPYGITGIYVRSTNHYFTYDSNVWHNIGRLGGIYMGNDHAIYTCGDHVVIINNIIYNMRAGFGIQVACYDPVDDVFICNNTFAYGSSYPILVWNSGASKKCSNVTIQNNVFYEPECGYTAIRFTDGTPASAENVIIRNNIACGASVIAVPPAGAVIQDNLDDTDPLLTNPGNHDFHLQLNSPAINTGYASGSPSCDYDETLRPTGSDHDMGAYEYALVAYWRLDDGVGDIAEDSSANGNDGTLEEMDISTCWVSGKIGGALEFDGIDDYVVCGNDASLNLENEITIEAWVKFNSLDYTGGTGTLQTIVAKPHSNTSTNACGFWMAYDNRSNWQNLRFAVGDDTAYGSTCYAATGELEEGQWYHFALVASNDGLLVYMNGNQIGTTAAVQNIRLSSTYNVIIGSYSSTDFLFNGAIDEVIIYSRVLSQQEIQQHYVESSIAALWHFDDGAGDEAEDSSTNDNDGTLEEMNMDTCWVSGKVGSHALEFDGIDDYVVCGNDASLNLENEITIEAWVKFNSLDYTGGTGTLQTIVAKPHSNTSTNACGFWMAYDNRSNWQNLRFAVGDDTAYGSTCYAATGELEEGQWYHFALVASNDGLLVYMNGNQIGTTAVVQNIRLSSTYNVIIGSYSSTDFLFNGAIDEVIIYSRVLSQPEIQQHYVESAVVALWHFDDGAGDEAEDSSTNDNDGTLEEMNMDTCWVSGKVGSHALEFDGIDDYVVCGNDASLNLENEITIEAWVKFNSLDYTGGTGSLQTVVAKPHNNTSTNACGFWMAYDNRSNWQNLRFVVGDDTPYGSTCYAATGELEEGQWYHFALVASDDGLLVYMNGNQLGTTAAVQNIRLSSSYNVTIGAYGGTAFLFNGAIDEVVIYSRVLTQAEIQQHWLSGQ